MTGRIAPSGTHLALPTPTDACIIPPEKGDEMEPIEETRSREIVEPTVEELEMDWWQPLSCGCEPPADD